VHDFVFDDGRIQNIHVLDKRHLARNTVQVIRQFEQTGTHANRYDVTLLVNGLPLVHIELKRRGVAIREAFNQIHRYSRESSNSAHSLYRFLQLFVISNGRARAISPTPPSATGTASTSPWTGRRRTTPRSKT